LRIAGFAREHFAQNRFRRRKIALLAVCNAEIDGVRCNERLEAHRGLEPLNGLIDTTHLPQYGPQIPEAAGIVRAQRKHLAVNFRGLR
jgi:hypothetical protein